MELCREQTVCFTGHRQIPLERDREIRLAAESTVRDLIMQGYDTFLVGGALGFDTLAQLTVIRLRREFPFLRVVMAIPCREQDSRWNSQDRAVYRQLCRLADETILLREEYTDDCMLVRNRYMVEHSSRCVSLSLPITCIVYTIWHKWILINRSIPIILSQTLQRPTISILRQIL